MNAVRVLMMVLALSTAALAQDASQDWLGWRGIERQGVHESATPPIEWSNEQNVDWVVDLPGEGHSSPVVSNGRVFVTTAYAVPYRDSVRQFLIAFTFGFIGLTAILGIRVTSYARVMCLEPGATTLEAQSALVAFIMALLGFVTLAVVGPPLLDFDRCIIRRWLGTNLTATLGLALAASAVRGSLLRAATVFALIGLGLGTLVALPSKEHAFRGGYASASPIVVVTVAAVPIVFGMLWANTYRRSPSTVEAILPATDQSNAVRGKFADRSIWTVLLAFGWFAAYWIGVADGPNTEVSSQLKNDKRTAVLTLALAVLIGVWFVRSLAKIEWIPVVGGANELRRGFQWRRFGLGFVAAVVLAGAFIGLIVTAIRCSDYLRYHLATPNGALIVPRWPYTWVSLALVAIGGVFTIFARMLSATRSYRTSAVLLWAAAVVSSALLFVDRNLVASGSVLTRAILCFDLTSGKQLWALEGLVGAKHQLHRYNSPATPTPVIAGDRLYAYFGSTGLLCATINGQRLWANPEIHFRSVYGVGVSPILHNNLVIIVNGVPDEPHIVACDAENGELVWRTELNRDSTRASGHSRTPLVCHDGDNDVLIVWGFNEIDGIDSTTGDKLWNVPLKSSGDLVASVVRDEDTLFFVDDSRTTAIPVDELLHHKSETAWSKPIRGSNCSTPIIYHEMLFMATDSGIITCLDSTTGNVHWRERLPGRHYASPVAANGYVYFMNVEGVTTVIAAASKFRIVASNDLDEAIFASPALTDDSMVVRTVNRLYKLTTK